MQDAEEADLCAEVSGIASDFEEGFRTGAEQEIIDDLFVLQHHRRQATRQGEEHMEIAPREKLLLTRGDPAVPSGGSDTSGSGDRSKRGNRTSGFLLFRLRDKSGVEHRFSALTR